MKRRRPCITKGNGSLVLLELAIKDLEVVSRFKTRSDVEIELAAGPVVLRKIFMLHYSWSDGQNPDRTWRFQDFGDQPTDSARGALKSRRTKINEVSLWLFQVQERIKICWDRRWRLADEWSEIELDAALAEMLEMLVLGAKWLEPEETKRLRVTVYRFKDIWRIYL